MKTKIIPFNKELAEKIQAGETKGAIKTKCGNEVRILCFDLDDPRDVSFPIACALYSDKDVRLIRYTKYGRYSGIINSELDLILEVPDEPQKSQFNSSYSIEQLSKLKEYTEQLMEVNQGVIDDLSNMIQELRKICNLSLKTKFKIGDKVSIGDYNEEGVEIYTIVKIIENLAFLNDGSTIPLDDLVLRESKHEFKPFDKVLVRHSDKTELCVSSSIWLPGIFQYKSVNSNLYFVSGKSYKDCIPYEGNEHLVGTTDKPKKLC